MSMTQEIWNKLSNVDRERLRSSDNLTPQLIGLEGWRVEVETTYNEKRRFIVSRSTGWVPCHIEISIRNAIGGRPADKVYKSVRRLYFAAWAKHAEEKEAAQ